MDFPGPFMGCMFMIVVDAYLKWTENGHTLNKSTAQATIEKLRGVFTTYGLPVLLVNVFYQ